MSSVIVPEGKTVYGYGGQKFKAGQTVTDKQVSSEVIKKLSGKVKKTSSKKTASGKTKYRKIGLDGKS
jgi:hypothetical protein